jgi:hypothetical protein
MALPKRVRIRYEPDYFTDTIGTFDGGLKQFMGFVLASHTKRTRSAPVRKQWFAVLHTFDKDGNHLGSDAWHAGDTEDGEDEAIDRARDKLDEWVAALGQVARKDVRIKLFSVELHGHRFALEDTSDDERGPSVTLWPNDFFFAPPWNGNYST